MQINSAPKMVSEFQIVVYMYYEVRLVQTSAFCGQDGQYAHRLPQDAVEHLSVLLASLHVF